jgi:hypothetical protein
VNQSSGPVTVWPPLWVYFTLLLSSFSFKSSRAIA